jgi:hypothetical protein
MGPPLVRSKVGGKGFQGREGAGGRWSQEPRDRVPTLFEQGFSGFLERDCCTLGADVFSWVSLAAPLPLDSPHPEGLGEEYLSLQGWKMTSLLKCVNFYLQRTSCFHPKEVLYKGPGTRLAVYEPVKYTAHSRTSSSWPVISCLLHLSESCNLVGSWATVMPPVPLRMGEWPLSLICPFVNLGFMTEF